MYEIFINDRPVILTETSATEVPDTADIIDFNGKKGLKEVLETFRLDTSIESLRIRHFDLEELWYYFRRVHKFIHAAGGRVVNDKGEYLCIHRLGKWDLPKGKLEKGETPAICAVREVEEECGISGLKILKPLKSTYHTYELKGEQVLKKSWWYDMHTSDTGTLIPQTEEGIDKVEWKSKAEMHHLADVTFPTLQKLFLSAE